MFNINPECMKKSITLFVLIIHFVSLQAQTDTLAPVLLCTAPSTLLVENSPMTVWAADFIDTLYDNQTAAEQIELGIRKACTGQGFPEDSPNAVIDWEKELRLEIWARDEAGNAAMCMVQFYVNYAGEVAQLQFHVRGGDIWQEAGFQINGSSCLVDTFSYLIPESYPLGSDQYLHVGDNFEVKPFKNDNPLNGVTTYDLVLIHKHILGLEMLDSPYKILAADANMDGKVTLNDLILLRRLILGIDNALPHGKSWRFVPYNYVFPFPDDPFHEPFPEKITVTQSDNPLDFSPFEFRGIKIGDVNGSATGNQ